MLTNGRLPKYIKPINYQIKLFPNFETFEFKGKVQIKFIIDSTNTNTINTNTIQKFALHSKQLKISKIKINNISCDSINYELDESNELLIINQPNIPKLSLNVLEISFDGLLNDDLKGFYRSKYVRNGVDNWIATTQFESTDARRAFPCFDEPSFKATFDVAIKTKFNKMVLSNMNVLEVISKGEYIITKFKTTPIMSTYLLAFIIADSDMFVNVNDFNITNKKVTVYGLPEEKAKLNFSLDVAIKCLDWFENWFGIEYPIEKMDLIGIPDFNAGAMENWGLITFRPTQLFCSENDRLDDKISVVTTIAHEIAHQWFGNLVTMNWWNYLWLNESMATYFGWLVCHELYPHWNVWDKFMDDEYNYALELDSLESSHPIEFNESIVRSAKDIDQIFDGISYSKGSCIVRCLVKLLGDEIFRKGMQIYITNNKYKNTTSVDLWNAFDIAVGNNNHNIANLMNDWTKQTGYPLIEVTSDAGCSCTKLKQSKYLKIIDQINSTNQSSLWKVPITFSGSCESVSLIMNEKDQEYPLNKNDCEFIINPERVGFYRVKYNVDKISDLPFKINSLSETSQKQIIDDMFSLALNGYQEFNLIFDLLRQIDMSRQTSSKLWSVILTNIKLIYDLLKNHEQKQNQLKVFIQTNFLSYVKNLLFKIGLDDNDADTTNELELRPLLINFLGLMKDIDIINHAKTNFANNKYHYYMRIVAENANIEEFNKLVLMLTNEKVDTIIRSEVIESIAYVSNSEFADQITNDILINKIRDQDINTLIAHLSTNKYTTYKIWNYAKRNWNKNRVFDLNSPKITNTIKYIGMGFCTEEDLSEYKNFFKLVGIPKGTQMVYDQTIERISAKILMTNRLLNINY